MWEELERLAEGESLTILLTTHYMEEPTSWPTGSRSSAAAE
jgi:ABC-type multidrug transport system ATPase subunit